MTLLSILVVVAICFALFGLFGGPRVGWGPIFAWSPLSLLVLLLLLLLLTGVVRW